MKKISLKKLSILGVVLMAASAVTAAILPATKDVDDNQANGSLVPSESEAAGNVGLTCIADATAQECNWTITIGNDGESDTSTGLVNTNNTSTDNPFFSTSAQGSNNNTTI